MVLWRGRAERQLWCMLALALSQPSLDLPPQLNPPRNRHYHSPQAPVAGPTADLEDKRERLAELVHKLEVAQAAAAYADTLACAEPCGRAEHAHTYTAAPLGLADFQERLSELCTAAAVVPEWAAYAEPGRALRCGAAPTEAPLSLADFADRLAELERREAACAACAALADSLGYIDACGRAEHARSYTAAPLDLDDLAERLAELEAKAAVVPEWCAYAEGGRAQRKVSCARSCCMGGHRSAWLVQGVGSQCVLAQLPRSLPPQLTTPRPPSCTPIPPVTGQRSHPRASVPGRHAPVPERPGAEGHRHPRPGRFCRLRVLRRAGPPRPQGERRELRWVDEGGWAGTALVLARSAGMFFPAPHICVPAPTRHPT